MKEKKDFYEFFPGYTKEQVDKAVCTLDSNDICIVEKRISNSLAVSDTKDYQRLYAGILPKIRRLLKNNTTSDVKIQTTESVAEAEQEKVESSQNHPNTTVKVEEAEPVVETIQDKSWMQLFEILRQNTAINESTNLSPKDLTIAYLKLGYVDGKYFSNEEISNFLGVEQDEIIATTKMVLVEYKKSMNSLLDKAISSVVEERSGKAPYTKKSENNNQ